MKFDFPPEIETLDSVPDDFKPFYTGDDGAYALSDDPAIGGAVKAIKGLSVALNTARRNADTYKGKAVDLSPLAEFGDSPAAILEGFQTQLADASGAKGKDVKAQVDRVRADMERAHNAKVAAKDAQIGKVTGFIKNRLVTSDAKAALAAAGAVDPDLVLPFVASQVALSESDDGFSVVVQDDKGEVRYSSVTGAPLTVDDLVSEFRANPKYETLFRSDAPQGGGTPPGGPRPATTRGGPKSATDKIQAGLRRLVR